MDKIEQVAREMWEVRRQKAGLVQIELEEWGDGSIPRANHIMDEARAAIEAMREPTMEMLLAAAPYPAHLVAERNDVDYTSNMQAATAADRMAARSKYQTMIDAALSTTLEKA